MMPAVLDRGFRPFFLSMAIWGAAAPALWLAILYAGWELPTAFAPQEWHANEMLSGFVGAAMTGFLLTAVPNWTGRLPVSGRALAGLWLWWVAARLAVAASGLVGPWTAATIDVGYWAGLLFITGREIVVGRVWRNVPVLVALGFWTAAAAARHASAIGWPDAGPIGERAELATALALIGLIGGRIIPSFTRNRLAARGHARLPAPFGRFDIIVLAATLPALALWAVRPEGIATALPLAAAGGLHLMRLGRWRGLSVLGEPLLGILHLGYLWLVAALLANAAVAAGFLPSSAGLHAAAGALTVMILAVATRATLGHTGRALEAGAATVLLYGLAQMAILLRLAAAAGAAPHDALLIGSGLAWTGSLALFVAVYGPILLRPRSGAVATA